MSSSTNSPLPPQPTNPPRYAKFLTPTGDAQELHIHTNADGLEGVLCALCHGFFKIATGGSTKPLRDHYNSKRCQMASRRRQRKFDLAAECAEEDAIHQRVFGSGATSSVLLFENVVEQAPTPLSAPDVTASADTATTSQTTSRIEHTEPAAVTDQLPRSSPPRSTLDYASPMIARPMTIATEITDSASDTSTDHFDPDNELKNIAEEDACTGQLVKWTPGSIYETYAYQQHDDRTLHWAPIGFEGDNYIRLRSKRCSILLHTDEEKNARACRSCVSILYKSQLRRMMERAQSDAPPHTPWLYLNARQLKQLLLDTRKKAQNLQLQLMNHKRKIGVLQRRVSDHQRNIMLLSEHKIAGVSQILQSALNSGLGPRGITERLQRAISGAYTPRGNWTDREFDVAFLIKALGGPRLLYAMQKAEAYPSLTTLKRHKVIPELLVSMGIPSPQEVKTNIETFLGEKGRKPTLVPEVGQVLMIDGVALEEVCRYDQNRNSVIGICREHSIDHKFTIDDEDDIENLERALKEDQTCHYGKDGTVVGIAPITSHENYSVVPLVLSASCKMETGAQMEL